MGTWDQYDFGKRHKPRPIGVMRERVRIARESLRLQRLTDAINDVAADLERVPLAERRRGRIERAQEALSQLEVDQ